MAEILNPQDAELEEVILGACLIGREAMPMVADRLRPEMFYFDKNALIYAAMQVMYREGRQIDIITVKNELARMGPEDALFRFAVLLGRRFFRPVEKQDIHDEQREVLAAGDDTRIP